MRKLIIIMLGLLIPVISVKAFDYDLTYTTGVFTGTAFWNSENFTGEGSIKLDDSYMRFYNRLRFKSELFEDFKVKINGLRSDNISGDNMANETKLYEAYAMYNLGNGYIKAGRFSEFNKWTMGSVDGAALSYKITDKLEVSGYGGLDVRYGKLFDTDNQDILAYGDLSYKEKYYGAKAKFYHSDDIDLTGLDVYTKFAGMVLSANVGYDLTESTLHDGGVALSGYAGGGLRYFANYNMMKPRMWNGYFNPESYQRVQAGLTYKLPWNMSVSAIQMATITEEANNYITYAALNHKYFVVGLNYMTGDSYFNRLGITLGGRYSPIEDLRLSAGFGTVDYIMNDKYYDESMMAITSYIRARYRFLEDFAVNFYGSYYHTDSDYIDNIRGGLTIQYHLGGGK